MRVFLLSLILCLYTTQSQATFWSDLRRSMMTEEEKKAYDEEEKKKKHFIGFSVGAGVMDLGFPFLNPRIWKATRHLLEANSLDYVVAIEGGWQKHTYEKVGIRNTLGFTFSYSRHFFDQKRRNIQRELFFELQKCQRTRLQQPQSSTL